MAVFFSSVYLAPIDIDHCSSKSKFAWVYNAQLSELLQPVTSRVNPGTPNAVRPNTPKIASKLPQLSPSYRYKPDTKEYSPLS